MSSRQEHDMIIISDLSRQGVTRWPGSDKHREVVLADLSVFLLDQGLPASEANSAVVQIEALCDDWRAGRMTDEHFDRVATLVIVTAMSRVRNRRAA